MSNLVRRMQRMAKRGQRAKKAAIGHQFATQVGVTNGMAKDLLARIARPNRKAARRIPLVLRRSKGSQKWLEARAAKRAAAAS